MKKLFLVLSLLCLLTTLVGCGENDSPTKRNTSLITVTVKDKIFSSTAHKDWAYISTDQGTYYFTSGGLTSTAILYFHLEIGRAYTFNVDSDGEILNYNDILGQ